MKSHVFSALGRRTEPPPVSWLMATALTRPELISLAAGFTDSESLPVEEARQTLTAVLHSRASARAALQYGTTAGDLALRRLTAKRVRKLDGAGDEGLYAAERMLLTNGSQQLLYMVTEALCDSGDIVLVEDPGYFVFLSILQSHGIQARGVRIEKDGIDLAHLETVLKSLAGSRQLSRLKLLYVVSYFQNPTGTTTAFAKKEGALNLLRDFERRAGHPIYLLEDAAYRELRFEGPEVKSALAAGRCSQRVIYAGTYSKPFATGVRVGFGLLPEPVLKIVLRIKGNHDFGSSNLLQQLLSRVISSGAYDSHLVQLRLRYAHKAAVMLRALENEMPREVGWVTPQGGLYFWARLPARVSSGMNSRLFKKALEKGVLYVPGELCYAADPTRRKPNNEMRLSFGAETEANIREGIRRLATAIRQI